MLLPFFAIKREHFFGVSFSNIGIKMSKRITVDAVVNEVHPATIADNDIIEVEKSDKFKEMKEKYPEFWKQFHCVVLSSGKVHPCVVKNKTTRQYCLGYPTSGHVCYRKDSFTAISVWVMHFTHCYESCLICPICEEVNPFD